MVELVEGARLESGYTLKAYRGFESLSLRHDKICHARWGGSGALHLQTARAGSNSRLRADIVGSAPNK